ncbi:hypothetical protein PIB30_091868 [Stylosanthes scabra]|uniref:Uncharacterized protein n=1 Tax=Stylosanthes scabra TaxID=79078 RepID=A0ABU6WUC3_9FABA|nr:hypothetical protein [Stylosanthes scabra]
MGGLLRPKMHNGGRIYKLHRTEAKAGALSLRKDLELWQFQEKLPNFERPNPQLDLTTLKEQKPSALTHHHLSPRPTTTHRHCRPLQTHIAAATTFFTASLALILTFTS